MKTFHCVLASIFATLGMSSVATSQSEAPVVRLRCDGLEQVDNRTYELWEIDFARESLVITSFYATGSHRSEFHPITEEQGEIIAFGMPNKRLTRASVNRNSGYARVEFPLDEAEKLRLGHPADKDVWMGYSLQCHLATQLF